MKQLPTNFQPGDHVQITLDGESLIGQVLDTFVTSSRTALRIHVPGRFPFTFTELAEWNATVTKLQTPTD